MSTGTGRGAGLTPCDGGDTLGRLVIVFAGVAFLIVWYSCLLVIPISTAMSQAGMSLAEFVEWHTGEFAGGFLEALSAIANPIHAWAVGGPLRWPLVLATAVSLWFCRFRANETPSRGVAGLPHLVAAVPVYVGLLLFPLDVKTVFRVLAEVGLPSTRLLGTGIAESLSLPYLGLLGSATCVAKLVLRSRRPSVSRGRRRRQHE